MLPILLRPWLSESAVRKRGVKAAAQLALAAFIFSTQVQEKRPDPTEDEAFPRLVGRIRLLCLDDRR